MNRIRTIRHREHRGHGEQACKLLLLLSVFSVFSVASVANLFISRAHAQTVSWSGKDIGGADVKIPASKPSIIVFVRADQDQSRQALSQIKSTVTDVNAVQVVVILSGPLASEQAGALKDELGRPWAIVADREFEASGRMNVHVWPTTLVIKSDGSQAAHLAGMPKSFAADLSAHLDAALGKIDSATLQRRLTTRDVVSDSPAQAAARHLQVANRLLEQGRTDQALAEITQGLTLAPADPALLLASARVSILQNKPAAAIEILDKLPANSLPPWQPTLVRARALIALEKWADAKAVLPDALKLNPNPSEAHYLLGLCYQHDNDSTHAAEQFRLAYEKK